MSSIETVVATVRRFMPYRTNGGVIYECRQCGTTVGPDTEDCPSCDSEGIVEYVV